MEKMIRRDKYLAQARMFAHDDIIIVVTGVRRCGKSTLLRMLREELQYNADSDDVFISANLENLDLNITTADDLYQYCISRLGKKNNYIFLDEIQNVPNWHRVVNSLRIKPGCHIFLTGSNARLFSGSLATYLSGRYVEIKMQPLVFSEYLNFLGLSPSDNPQMLLDSHNAPLLTDAVLEQFLRWGGFPALAQSTVTQEQHEIYLQSIYDTVIERDIMMREHLRSLEGQPRGIKNADLLRTLCTFLADNVGNPCSYSSIARALKPAITTTDKTVANYINTLNEAYIFEPVTRYDLHGKHILRTAPKQYVVDLGLRSFLLGYRDSDSGRAFENLVYLQLRYLGYSVHVGSLYGKEIDFVCEKAGQRIYIQVTESMVEKATQVRELAPLEALHDNFPKFVITRQGIYPPDINGIKIINAAQFLLAADPLS